MLVTFWTYSCLSCRRALPHYESWYHAYPDSGLVVLGVHNPEFAFEHEAANVADQTKGLGVDYPVAIDNDYATWQAYGNQYWPASSVVDASGQVRGSHFGEGSSANTEQQLRQLLTDAGSGPQPAPTDVPDTTPAEPTSPETDLGPKNAPSLRPRRHVDGGTRVPHRRPGRGCARTSTARTVHLVLAGTGTTLPASRRTTPPSTGHSGRANPRYVRPLSRRRGAFSACRARAVRTSASGRCGSADPLAVRTAHS
ncbi:redoxin domain-containing protein [Amycolatopsis sp. FDAARGOS 1241]|uniref:redoxin domain-containing protein n=1 Tax=Amycolatopsis sp. FDAARGOS 1241 TaxID=2778070 RepID=UPI00351C3C2B